MQIPQRERGQEPARVGDRVIVRGQPWRVADVRPDERCQVLTLVGIGADNIGIAQHVVTPYDTVEHLPSARPHVLVSRSRWRAACAALLAAHGAAGQLRVAREATLDLLPHQLEPALAIVRGLGCRILIADDVGLGKTVQAALILAELLERGAVDRALLVTPAGLREQWMSELAARFALTAAIFDATEVRRRAALLPPGINPWNTEPVVVTSIDFAKRPEVLPAIDACRWDLVLVDEAHGLTPATDRLNAMTRLCRVASYVVLITATPHSGDRVAFQALCGIGRAAETPADDRLIVFRRTRVDAGMGCARRIHHLVVPPTKTEARMYTLLDRLARAVLREREQPGGHAPHDPWIVLTILWKRALSSAASLHRSLVRRLARSGSVPDERSTQLGLPFVEDGEEQDEDAAPTWSMPLLRDGKRERDLLEDLTDAAREASGRESKLAALGRLLRRLRRLGEPAIVFTEYRDTLVHVRKMLGLDAVVLHGGLGREARRTALAAFISGQAQVLLATDAAGEGLNLHHRCRVVVNLELPWNPMRLEQRLGRVDRIGQSRRVHGCHLIARGTAEERLLDRLRGRIRRARADVGGADPLGASTSNARRDRAHFYGRSFLETQSSRSEDPDTRTTEREPWTLLRLEEDGRREAERIERTRLMCRKGRLQVPDRAYVRFTRRRRTREHLGTGALVVLASTIEDAVGRVAAVYLTSLSIKYDPAGRFEPRRALAAILQSGAVSAAAPRDAAFEDWRAESLATCHRFLRARLEREAAIVLERERRPAGAFQPSLFDRRAELGHADAAARLDAALEESNRRRERIERAADLAVQPARVVLVLAP